MDIRQDPRGSGLVVVSSLVGAGGAWVWTSVTVAASEGPPSFSEMSGEEGM